MKDKHIYYLSKDATWEGELFNFVNMNEGIRQHGKNILEVSVDQDVITLRNKFFNESGKQTGYEGIAKMKKQGDKLISLDNSDVDPNTNNKIENHIYNGYITHNHIYIYEEYKEVISDQKKEHRRNEVHYYFLNEDELITTISVYVNNALLVFGNSHLKRVK